MIAYMKKAEEKSKSPWGDGTIDVPEFKSQPNKYGQAAKLQQMREKAERQNH